jgi:hypothetical protein
MNENDFDRTARAWLDDGPTRMADHALLSALKEIHTTRQRRAMWPVSMATSVTVVARVAMAAVLVVAVGLVAADVIRRVPDRSSVGGASPSPSLQAALDFPDLTTTFVSPRNGFSVRHPDRVALTPAKQLWGFSKQVDDGFDLVETGLGAFFQGASTEIPDGASIDDGVDAYLSEDSVSPGSCRAPRSQQAEITIDGRPGKILECPKTTEAAVNEVVATVVAGGRLYLFALLSDRSDFRAVFDAFAATIELTPETAVTYPGLTSTFVSPINGFSVKYLDRGEGTVTPATELWDPVSQPPIDETELAGSLARYLRQFDVVETGLGAVYKGASTEIPDGASIDDWVDAAVVKYLPRGCAVPRSQQATITIDGQSGKISAKCGEVAATVLAGGRLYLFLGGTDRSDTREFFDAVLATIDLTPETAAVPSSTPSP